MIDVMTLNIVMVTRTLDFVWMFHRGTHILHTNLLPAEALREKCSYLEFFWSIPKYRPEKLQIQPLHAVKVIQSLQT